MRIEQSADIAADPEIVWALNTDVEAWPTMTPTVSAVERLDPGPLTLGSRARIVQPGQRPTVWTVTSFDQGRSFEWEAKVFGMRTVAGHHIEPTAAGCRNTLVLEMTGGLTPLLGRVLANRLAAVLRTELAGFRKRAETSWLGSEG